MKVEKDENFYGSKISTFTVFLTLFNRKSEKYPNTIFPIEPPNNSMLIQNAAVEIKMK